MSCPSDEVFVDHLEGRLSPSQRGELEAHVDQCPDCAALFADLHCDRTAGPTPQDSVVTRDVLPAARRLRPGAKFGRYVIVRSLGSGGMGVVYEAQDPQLDRRVAIKTIRDDHDATQLERLRREAQALAAANHPAIVPVFDVGTTGERVYVAMELVCGPTLSTWARTKPPVSRIVDVFVQAARGLAAAHRVGVIHRDFKPSNVMLDDDGRVRIVDFGLARAPGSIAEPSDEQPPVGVDSLTMTGTVLGTPGYMAPEQWRGTVCPETDQFAFCVALFELLYGHRPFDRGVPQGEPTGARPTGVPRRIDVIVRRGLMLEASDRFDSMDALAEALTRGARPARRWAPLWGTSLLVGGIVLATTAGDTERTCADPQRRLEPVWGTAQREAMVRGASNLSMPSAVDTVERVASGLDAYATRWSRGYEQACARETGAARDASMLCLSASLHAMDTLVRTLRTPDEPTLLRAVTALSSLPDLDACDEPGPLTETLATAEAVAAARTLLAAGRYAEALQSATDASVEASAPLQRATFDLLIGQAHDGLGSADEAKASWESAYFAAADAGAPELEARAAIALLLHTAVSDSDREASERWRGHAESAIERSGTPADLQARLYGSLGSAAGHFGDASAALEHYDQALAINADDEADERRVYRANRAATLMALGRYEDAREAYADVVAEHRSLLGDHPHTAIALDNAGAVLRESGEPDEAIEHHEAALAVFERTVGREHPEAARSLANLCTAQYTVGEYDAAIANCRDAVSVRERTLGPDDPAVAKGLGALAIALRLAGQHEESIATLLRAREIVEASVGHEHPTAGVLAMNLAQAYVAAGQTERALRSFERAEAVWSSTLAPAHPNLVALRRAHAAALRRTGALEAAERRVVDALAAAEEAGVADVGVAPLRLEYARVLAATERVDEGRKLALRVAEQLADSDPEGAADARDWARSLADPGPD